MTGTSFNTSYKKGAAAVGSGRIAVDSAGKPFDGCLAIGGTLALAGGPQMSLPVGSAATNRVATYQVANILSQPVPDTKTGAITCPAGTTVSYSQILSVAQLAPVICSLPPVAAVPDDHGQRRGRRHPDRGARRLDPWCPERPELHQAWYRCSATGTGCAPIPGATASTYTLQYGPGLGAPTGTPPCPAEPTDCGHIFSVTVTGTNLDGSDSATSAQTIQVKLPPPPTIATAPVLGPNRQIGVATTIASNGTYNNGATSFAYQWQRVHRRRHLADRLCRHHRRHG